MELVEIETYTVQEVADILKVSVDTIKRRYMRLKNNPMPVFKLSNRVFRIPKKRFLEWLQHMPDPRIPTDV